MKFEVGRIVELRDVEERRLALVDFGHTRRPVFIDPLLDAHVGDYVKVRAGLATELADPSE